MPYDAGQGWSVPVTEKLCTKPRICVRLKREQHHRVGEHRASTRRIDAEVYKSLLCKQSFPFLCTCLHGISAKRQGVPLSLRRPHHFNISTHGGGKLNTFMIGSTAPLTTFHAWHHYTPSYRGRVARYPVGSREWLSANDDRCRGRWPESPRR
jgi:hypothetical protein